ncbi:hypothetical protein D3C72_1618930 [compost metagenome]
MDLLDASGQADQFRQLFAMTGVIALENMLDQARAGLGAPVQVRTALGLQAVQFGGDLFGLDSAQGRGLAQALVAATTEIEVEGMEHPCGTGNVAGQAAKRLVEEGRIHGDYLVH